MTLKQKIKHYWMVIIVALVTACLSQISFAEHQVIAQSSVTMYDELLKGPHPAPGYRASHQQWTSVSKASNTARVRAAKRKCIFGIFFLNRL